MGGPHHNSLGRPPVVPSVSRLRSLVYGLRPGEAHRGADQSDVHSRHLFLGPSRRQTSWSSRSAAAQQRGRKSRRAALTTSNLKSHGQDGSASERGSAEACLRQKCADRSGLRWRPAQRPYQQSERRRSAGAPQPSSSEAGHAPTTCFPQLTSRQCCNFEVDAGPPSGHRQFAPATRLLLLNAGEDRSASLPPPCARSCAGREPALRGQRAVVATPC